MYSLGLPLYERLYDVYRNIGSLHSFKYKCYIHTYYSCKPLHSILWAVGIKSELRCFSLSSVWLLPIQKTFIFCLIHKIFSYTERKIHKSSAFLSYGIFLGNLKGEYQLKNSQKVKRKYRGRKSPRDSCTSFFTLQWHNSYPVTINLSIYFWFQPFSSGFS